MPTYSTPDAWPIPTYPEPGSGVDAPATISAVASAIEATLTGNNVQTWTPTWVSQIPTQPYGLASLYARYIDRQGWRTFSIYATFGAGTNGGNGILGFTLPDVCTATYRQFVHAELYVPGVTRGFHGPAQIDPGQGKVVPIFPVSDTNSGMAWWQNCDAGGLASTGYPYVGGTYNVQNGGLIHVGGTYRPA